MLSSRLRQYFEDEARRGIRNAKRNDTTEATEYRFFVLLVLLGI
jgi:hypothetical protein